MKIALIQMGTTENKKKNLEIACDYINKAAKEGADFVILPEMFLCPYETKNFPIYAEEERGESWNILSEVARESSVYLVAGTMPERDRENHIYNTCYVFDREGKQIGKHRKIHLFDIDIKGGQSFRESDTLTAGNEISTFDTEFGTFGLEICYDIRFPEMARLTERQGAKVIFIPACFNMTTGPRHWELLFRTRAMDTQVFMVGCAQARQNTSYVSYGHSIITSPWGDVVAQMDEKEGMILQEINLDIVEQVREQLPFIKQRRIDLYSI